MKNEILGRIRAAMGTAPVIDGISREYRQSGTLTLPERLDLLAGRLEDYNARVSRCSESALPQTIAEILSTRGKSSLLIPFGLPPEWLPSGFPFVRDAGLSWEEMDGAEGALTACTTAIAMTGTIILTHSAREGRRALTLIPDYHLCLIREDQVVETVPEGIRALKDFVSRPITTISGPSATSDIEMTRIKGVHGPRTLEVIIVSSD